MFFVQGESKAVPPPPITKFYSNNYNSFIAQIMIQLAVHFVLGISCAFTIYVAMTSDSSGSILDILIFSLWILVHALSIVIVIYVANATSQEVRQL